MQERIIVFGAHPDDGEIGAGGAIAAYARRGHRVVMVNVRVPGGPDDAVHHDRERRRAEAERAARALVGGGERIALARALVRMREDLPIAGDLRDFAWRGADRPALEALHRSLGPNQEKRIADLDAYLKQKIAEQEAVDRRTVEAFGAHRLHLPASDGFLLGAALNVLVPGSPVAVVLMSTGDSLGVYDSLATRFADSGFATLLIERRGSGGSVGPEVAVAGDTYGRQEALENRIARDAFDALRAAARLIQLDTTRVVLVGVRDSAPTAIRAMTLSPRARGLVLISPKPILIELGASRARLAKARRPLFIQLAIDEGYMFHSSDIYMDALYRASDASRSRVVEARMVGGGPTLFRRDPTLWERIDQWLTGALSAPTSTRPPASRKG
ncbi:MAG: alpha/beta hydrolase [Candidatus Eiseniibacteriota bacterium]